MRRRPPSLVLGACLTAWLGTTAAACGGSDGSSKAKESGDAAKADARANADREAKDDAEDANEDPSADAAPPLPEPALLVPIGPPPASARKPVVGLPSKPSWDAATVPSTYPDGVWSVAGLREEIDARLAEGEAGKEVMVRAYVQEIYVPPSCPEGEVCPPAKQPHLWITDTPDERGRKRAMLLVNYRFQIPEWEHATWRDEPEVIVEKGKQYTFRGLFRQFSDTGFASANGLLEFRAYRPRDPDTGAELPDWVYPPGAVWHPKSIAIMEEQNAKLAERMRKAGH